MSFRLGVVGAGQLSREFMPLWTSHPRISSVIVADRHPERRAAFARDFGVETETDADALLDSTVDAVAIFTQRHLHGPIAIAALEAGKHVYSAVPMAIDLGEIEAIIRIVRERRLVYTMGETCLYYPGAMFCRQEMRRGGFGDFVYAESQYIHDMRHGFVEAFQHSGGPDWQRVAGFPPMYYSTHTVGPLLAATGAHVTRVAAFGIDDRADDGIFGVGRNLWDNPFSNQVALHQLSNGGVHRVVEFRRAGFRPPGTHIGRFVGTEGTYEFDGFRHTMHRADRDGTMQVDDVSALLNTTEFETRCADPEFAEDLANGRVEDVAAAPILRRRVLPAAFDGVGSAHRGTHPHLVDDFARAVVAGALPPVDAWAAARATIPGILSHHSALAGGMPIDVPDHGDPPEDWPRLAERILGDG
ncbi:MAG TPA: Gfo/Idh/MocA family oxidoreductase [Terrimesophilobacter sp.]|nr:Gfo/Idh/MocA family oxidoreductase [Terrimesophilobacter sp.]